MRIVIKIGTTTLVHAGGSLNIRRVEELCKTISDLRNAGWEIIIVSSGAIGMGSRKLNLTEKPPYRLKFYDAYIDKLFADVSSLYRLDQHGGALAPGSRRDLGPLPREAVTLLRSSLHS